MNTLSGYEISREEKIWALFCHALTLLRILPFFWTVLVPLAIWIAKRERSRFIDEHGRESINFQLSVLLYHFVLGSIFYWFRLGWFVNYLLEAIVLVCVIVASIRASEGRPFRYPGSIRFVRKRTL